MASILEFAKCFLLLFHLKFTITSDFIKLPLHLTHEEIKVKEITDLKITQLKEVEVVTKLLHMTQICSLLRINKNLESITFVNLVQRIFLPTFLVPRNTLFLFFFLPTDEEDIFYINKKIQQKIPMILFKFKFLNAFYFLFRIMFLFNNGIRVYVCVLLFYENFK